MAGVARLSRWVPLLLLGLTAGCKTTYVLDVDALSTPGAEIYKTYIIVSGDKNIPPDDLQFLEFSKYLQRGLELQGYEPADKDQADIVIALSYKISKPQLRIGTYDTPTYGYQYGYGYYRPVYGVTGYETEVYSYEVYIHTMKLIARETSPQKTNDEGKEVWRVVVKSTNESNDIRAFFPYLIAAAQPFIACQTPNGSAKVKIKQNADIVMMIRYGPKAWRQMREEKDKDKRKHKEKDEEQD